MIIKGQFTPITMWPYARFELTLGAASSLIAWLLIDRASLHQFALPVAVATVLGTALSILLAVRVNTAYQRWWEASAIWAQILGMSRTLVRVMVAVTNAKAGADPVAVQRLQRNVAARQIAYAAALRIQLRGTDPGELDQFLDQEDTAVLAGIDNRASLLLGRQSARIYRAYTDGILTGFDNFQMEGALAGLSIQQALAERTKMQPVPATYTVFSRYFVHLYTAVFPFSVIATLPSDKWLIIPATLVIAVAFRLIERIGAVTEAPFSNTVQGLPMTAITTLLERDLRELLGDPARPPSPQPKDGYLW